MKPSFCLAFPSIAALRFERRPGMRSSCACVWISVCMCLSLFDIASDMFPSAASLHSDAPNHKHFLVERQDSDSPLSWDADVRKKHQYPPSPPSCLSHRVRWPRLHPCFIKSDFFFSLILQPATCLSFMFCSVSVWSFFGALFSFTILRLKALLLIKARSLHRGFLCMLIAHVFPFDLIHLHVFTTPPPDIIFHFFALFFWVLAKCLDICRVNFSCCQHAWCPEDESLPPRHKMQLNYLQNQNDPISFGCLFQIVV